MSPRSPTKRRTQSACPCGRDAYEACCGPFHLGRALPERAEQLMRSRYAAFAMRLEGYLLRTWAPEQRPAHLSLADAPKFVGLEILETHAGGAFDETGVVEFRASYVTNGQKGALWERSRFRRLREEDGRWVYLDGEIR